MALSAVAMLGVGAAPRPSAANSANVEAALVTPRSDLQALVDDLRSRLAIAHDVTVEIVPSNARLVSVTRHPVERERFHLAVEDGFFETLTADERQAALAHELGHVWIFTNHPYLQTEQLANRIALRVVTRESLASLYEKMWSRTGTKGDLARFLGEAAPSLPAGIPAETRAVPAAAQ